MRLLLDIRFGTERYPEKVARRLRTVNIGTRLATAFHAHRYCWTAPRDEALRRHVAE